MPVIRVRLTSGQRLAAYAAAADKADELRLAHDGLTLAEVVDAALDAIDPGPRPADDETAR